MSRHSFVCGMWEWHSQYFQAWVSTQMTELRLVLLRWCYISHLEKCNDSSGWPGGRWCFIIPLPSKINPELTEGRAKDIEEACHTCVAQLYCLLSTTCCDTSQQRHSTELASIMSVPIVKNLKNVVHIFPRMELHLKTLHSNLCHQTKSASMISWARYMKA